MIHRHEMMEIAYGQISDIFFFSAPNNGMEIMMMEFLFPEAWCKPCQNAALTRVQTEPPLREAKISPSFSVGFVFALKQDGFPIRIIRRMSPA